MRHHDDWLEGFREYCMNGEAPENMLFWVGVSAVAGALQRKVFFDMGKFRWYPNFFIVLVAPPGIVAKSTTSGYAMELLKKVEGVKFCPSVLTWQALVARFQKVQSDIIIPIRNDEGKVTGGEGVSQSAMTLFSSELGTLLHNNDRDMLDALTQLYDCASFEKETMKDGVINVENPCLNLVACTTPEWISSNFSAYSIGSGLMSRMLMVYASEKRQLVAWPGLIQESEEEKRLREALIADLQDISEMGGQMQATEQAYKWGKEWYEDLHKNARARMGDSRADGYLARKQAHVVKLAMVLSASRSSDMIVTTADLKRAVELTGTLEKDMPMLFDFMGKTRDANQADRIVEFVRLRPGCSTREAYSHVHNYFPKVTDFDDVLKGLLKSGILSNAPFGNRVGLVVTDTLAAKVG